MSAQRGRLALSALVALACAATVLSPAAHAEELRLHRGRLDAIVWTPDNDAAALWPVVVFSHGIFMCANQSRFITEAIAAAGYLVIAPNHSDANCSFNREAREERRSPATSDGMSSDAYADRARDISAALDALAADPQLSAHADLSRVALAGHSLGGYTVLAMGGALPTWKLPRVSAIVAFAPFTLPFGTHGNVHDLDAPVMYQVGSLDPIFTFPVANLEGAYERSPAPKYYVEIAGASHLAWVGGVASGKEAIVDYAIAFLDCYVKGEPESVLLQTTELGVAALRRDVGDRITTSWRRFADDSARVSDYAAFMDDASVGRAGDVR